MCINIQYRRKKNCIRSCVVCLDVKSLRKQHIVICGCQRPIKLLYNYIGVAVAEVDTFLLHAQVHYVHIEFSCSSSCHEYIGYGYGRKFVWSHFQFFRFSFRLQSFLEEPTGIIIMCAWHCARDHNHLSSFIVFVPEIFCKWISSADTKWHWQRRDSVIVLDCNLCWAYKSHIL